MSPEEFDKLEKQYSDEFTKKHYFEYDSQIKSLKKKQNDLLEGCPSEKDRIIVSLSMENEMQALDTEIQLAKRKYIFRRFMTEDHDKL